MTTNQDFKNQKYCVIHSAVSKDICDIITQYSFFEEMQNLKLKGDSQVPNSISKYGDPAMEALLAYLHPQMEQATGLKLIPTYSYFRIYSNGDDLKAHTDRHSCEISATLCFNYSYDDSRYTWPIFMDGKPITLQPGDMAVYKGMEIPHWRSAFDIDEPDSWQVQGFFHYVDADGPHKGWAFDKRESLGQLTRISENQSPKSYIEFTKD
jgi:hypothetical protein